MKDDYSGMTVNERLFVANMLDEFDLAVKKRNVEVDISILKSVELSDDNVEVIIKSLGLTDTE